MIAPVHNGKAKRFEPAGYDNMFDFSSPPLTLTFEPKALERCFLVADIMDEVYGEPHVEYGLLGVAQASRPFHVIETPMLTGQSVTGSSVDQSGINVLRMRREIQELSRQLGAPLVPISFIHRHPNACTPSKVDEEFLTGVFIDQISTAYTFQESFRGELVDCLCERCAASLTAQSSSVLRPRTSAVELEYAVCFSLIVNKERQHSIFAARKQFCPACGAGQVHLVPARMEVAPQRALTADDRGELRNALVLEIEAKVEFIQEASRGGET